MEDLIKREDAIKAISISCGTCLARDTEDCDKCSVPKLCGLISAIPSADRPSKEGEWEIEEFTSTYGKGYRLTCSECGDVVTVTDEALPRECYCRHCGAKNTKRWKGADDESD